MFAMNEPITLPSHEYRDKLFRRKRNIAVQSAGGPAARIGVANWKTLPRS
jgi:hypothetical protein